MFKKPIKAIYIVYVLVSLIILTLFLSVKIPLRIQVTGKLISSKEWFVTKGTDGRLISLVRDHIKGNSQNYSVNLFVRGDVISYKLSPQVTAGYHISKNDTVGVIQSNEVQRNLSSLQGQLMAKQAELEMYRSGEKESLIEMARQNLLTAKKSAEMQHQIAKRQKELFQRNLVSQEQYEIEQAKADVLDAEVQLSIARLNSLLEGAKEEQIIFIETQIQAIEREVNIYKERLAKSAILAPISGITTNTFSSDTLLHVMDVENLVFLFPINWRNKIHIEINQLIGLNIPDIKGEITARVISVGNNILTLGGRHTIVILALVKNSKYTLSPGLMVQGKLYCGKVTLLGYLKHILKSISY